MKLKIIVQDKFIATSHKAGSMPSLGSSFDKPSVIEIDNLKQALINVAAVVLVAQGRELIELGEDSEVRKFIDGLTKSGL